MIWNASRKSGVFHHLDDMLSSLKAANGAKTDDARVWLDQGQRASLAGLGHRFCVGTDQLGRPGAILADEVGMGKTRIAVALALAVARAKGRTVVMVPPGLIHQWHREIQDVLRDAGNSRKRLPELRVCALRGIDDLLEDQDPKEGGAEIAASNLILISHGLLNFRMKAGRRADDRIKVYLNLIQQQTDLSSALLDQTMCGQLQCLHNSKWHPDRLTAEMLRQGEPKREVFINFLLSRIGLLDLLVIDEAHKSKVHVDEKSDREISSSLARLVERLALAAPATGALRRLALTATPFELGPENWGAIVSRCGGSPKDATACVKASANFSKALKAVKLVTTPDTVGLFKAASKAFEVELSPWLIRRRKVDEANNSVLSRYVKKHGRDYRQIESSIAKVDGPIWPRAALAVEALSLMPDADVKGQKRLRLAMAQGFSLATTIDAVPDGEKNDWSTAELLALDETQSQRQTDPKRRLEQRAKFWLKVLEAAGRTPFQHPALLRAVTEIESITAPTGTAAPEKVLVFGRFTAALRNLTDLLNARELIRRLMVFKDDPDAPPSKWVWHGEVLPDDKDFQAAFNAALEMEDMVRLLNGADYDDLVKLVAKQYGKHRYLRQKDFEGIRRFVQDTSDPALRLFRLQDVLLRPLASALIEILDEHRARGREIRPHEAWDEFKRDLAQLEEEAGDVEDRGLAKKISAALEEYKGLSGRFARRLAGGMEASTKQHLQNAFNRRSSWPMVLVAQSLVGREGLNLHKSCRTVVLYQPEWNPGVVEQQIGRVDRMGSLWEEMVASHMGKTPPKIRVLRIVFPGSYDEHNWAVLDARWSDYRAQMSGEVFSESELAEEGIGMLKAEVNKAAPRFPPTRCDT
jgi:ERCC4-related helicase